MTQIRVVETVGAEVAFDFGLAVKENQADAEKKDSPSQFKAICCRKS
jgi:hypothetical protein